MASIIVMTGAQKGNYYPLGHRTNVVDRDEGLLIQILDEHVSRKHMHDRFRQRQGAVLRARYEEQTRRIYQRQQN